MLFRSLIVGYMHPQLVNAGEVLIREGEASDSGFMALVVDGEVTVENASASDESVVVTVLGPSSLIGEMGFIANVPRSAICVATTDLALAVLTIGNKTDFRVVFAPKIIVFHNH